MVLDYFVPSPEEFERHVARCERVPSGESVKRSVARQDATYWCVNQLDITPRVWQSKMWDLLDDGKNVMVCSSRQVGKTLGIAAYSLRACQYNLKPLPTTGSTRIIIVSASEEQSKKIISDIKELIRRGDRVVERLTGGKIKDYYSNMIDRSQAAANNKSAITFKNGCQIFSLPPTERARGYTATLVFIDEAAFIEDEDIYSQTIKPIVSAVKGQICMTSTPNGQQGFFYKLFDPNDELPVHEYERLWIPYTAMRLDDPSRVEELDRAKQVAISLGEERKFAQEYEATFNVSTTSFFDSEDVDKVVSKELVSVDSYEGECDLAVDFGNVVSRTVITISALDYDPEKGDFIRLLYQYEYPPREDLSLVDDIVSLSQRFNIQRFIFESCPASDTFRQDAEKRGLNVVMWEPTKNKAKKYFALRAWVKQGRVVIPGDQPDLVKQMKGLIQEDTPRTTKIYHGAGLRDDRIDSFMMSTVFFTEETGNFRVIDVDDYW